MNNILSIFGFILLGAFGIFLIILMALLLWGLYKIIKEDN